MNPELSVVCMLGSRRERLPRIIDSLAAQTAAARLEVVAVQMGEAQDPPQLPEAPPWKLISMPPGHTFGQARAEAARRASGDVVAYLLDNAYPDPGWAEALLAAYGRGPWAAVGYCFRNLNPGRYVSRASCLFNFAPWEPPLPEGEVPMLPGNNVSYRRSDLIVLGAELDTLLDVDASVHRRLLRAGGSLAIAPQATAAVESFERLGDACRANAVYGSAMAGARAETEGYRLGRRLVHAIATPVLAPALILAGVWKGARRRSAVASAMPVLVLLSVSRALGEAKGYLSGRGSTPVRLIHWELDRVREPA